MDNSRLNQVLVNLLSNAAKFSPKADRIIIRVRVPMSAPLDGEDDNKHLGYDEFQSRYPEPEGSNRYRPH